MRKIVLTSIILTLAGAAFSATYQLNEKDFLLQMLKNSYDAQSVSYDYMASQQSEIIASALYNPEVYANLSYNSSTNAPSGLLNGLKATSLGLGLSKLFNTGTVASVEIGGQKSTSLLSFDFETSTPNVEKQSYDPYLSVSLVQPLLKGGIPYLPGRIILDLNKNTRLLNEVGTRMALESLVYGALLQYHQFLNDFALLKINEDSLSDFSALYAKYKRQYQYGSISQSDLYRFESQVKQLEISVRKAKMRLEHDLATISTAVRTNISLTSLEIVDTFLAGMLSNTVELAYQSALDNGTDVIQSRLLINNSELFYNTAKNDTLPELNFSSSFKLNGNYSGTAEDSWNQAFQNMNYNEFFVGLEFRMPFLAPSEKAKVLEAEYNKRKAESDLKSKQEQLWEKIEDKIVEIDLGTYAIQKYEELQLLHQKIVKASEKDYSNGEISSRDLVTANEDLRRAKTSYVLEVLGYKLNVLELELLKGTLLDVYGIKMEYFSKN